MLFHIRVILFLLFREPPIELFKNAFIKERLAVPYFVFISYSFSRSAKANRFSVFALATGYVYDFMIATTAQRDNRIVTLSVNDALRGSVSLSAEGEEFEYGVELTATATTKGNSNFVCWRQGSAVVSTDASYTFNVNGDVRLTAYFSPNTEQETGISAIELSDEDAVVVEQQGSSLVVTADSEVSSVDVYTVGASLAAHADSAAVSVAHLSEGVYIVRVTTTEGYRNIKIYIIKTFLFNLTLDCSCYNISRR